MDKKNRYLFIANAMFSGIAVVFIATSLGTEYWIVADLQRIVDDEIKNATGEDLGSKFTGDFHAGLFSGEKILDYGYNPRHHVVKVRCDAGENLCLFEDQDGADSPSCVTDGRLMGYKQGPARQEQADDAYDDVDDYLFSFALWLCTIITAAIAMLWGIVAIGFSVLNASRRPIEMITGPMGLYLWNSLAAAFGLLCITFYVVLFAVDLSKNVLEPCDIVDRWTSEDRARLDYSFYFVIIATVLFLINICVMAISGVTCRRKQSFAATMSTKALDGVMMY